MIIGSSEKSQIQWKQILRHNIIVENADPALYDRAVRLFTAPNSIAADCLEHMALPPRMHIYKELPPRVSPIDEDGATLHIALGSESDEALIKSMMHHYQYSPAYLLQSQHHMLRSAGYLINLPDESENLSLHHRTRGDFDPTDPALSSTRIANTAAHLRDWKYAYQDHIQSKKSHPDQPTLWEYYQQRMFSPEVMQKFSGTTTMVKKEKTVSLPSWKLWLRGLRVMNGLSIVQMSDILGTAYRRNGGNYTELENLPNRSMTDREAYIILHRNIFHLPEIEKDGKKTVDPACAEKFCRMMGCSYPLSEKLRHEKPKPARHMQPLVDRDSPFLAMDKERIFDTVKLLAQDYLAGNITYENLPPIQELLAALELNFSKPRQNLVEQEAAFKLNGEDYRPYFSVMPSLSYRHTKMASESLSQEQALTLAENTADTIGKFIKIYRMSTGLAGNDVGKDLGSVSNLSMYERSGKLSDNALKKILSDDNPYRFPTDESGHIRQDVAEYLQSLNDKCGAKKHWQGKAACLKRQAQVQQI